MNIYDEITLIIVCFNSEKLIQKNLNELKKFRIIIIDNKITGIPIEIGFEKTFLNLSCITSP